MAKGTFFLLCRARFVSSCFWLYLASLQFRVQNVRSFVCARSGLGSHPSPPTEKQLLLIAMTFTLHASPGTCLLTHRCCFCKVTTLPELVRNWNSYWISQNSTCPKQLQQHPGYRPDQHVATHNASLGGKPNSRDAWLQLARPYQSTGAVH